MKTITELMQDHSGKWPADPRAPRKPTLWDASARDFAGDLLKGGTPNYPDGSQQEYASFDDDDKLGYVDPRYIDDNADQS